MRLYRRTQNGATMATINIASPIVVTVIAAGVMAIEFRSSANSPTG
jgi:hypothetical protein